MNGSINAYIRSPNLIIENCWYEGSDALKEGEAVCYNTDYATTALPATSFNGERLNRVERPSTSNNLAFAGVATRNYPAVSGGQFIEIAVPGSKGVKIALGADVTINTGILTFTAGSAGSHRGRFVKAGFLGRGSAWIRQTVTALIESNMTGGWSLDATDGKTLTVSDTTGLSVGDTVVLLGGENDGTGALVPGKYVIASITNGTVLVLTASALSALTTGAITCTGYAYTGNPTAQADLLTGEESGGVEFVCPPNTGGAAVMTYMVGGMTYILGGVTVGTADANGALADGAFYGLKKGFYCLGTLTTNDAKVTPATAGKQLTVTDIVTDGQSADGTPKALASAAFDAANERLFLEWHGLWYERGSSGCTIAAS